MITSFLPPVRCGIAALLLLTGCAVTSHDATPLVALPATAPAPSPSWIELAATPGHITLTHVESATWEVDREGLINLDHPRARAAGLTRGPEPISVSFHVITHPERGIFLVDSGVARSFEPGGEEPPVSALLISQMNMDALDVKLSMADWLATHGPVEGVFLTHLHLDHIMGVPDLPEETKLYAGPRETSHRRMLHMFTHGTTDRLLKGHEALHTWSFAPDPAGLVEGIVDVFGDGEVFALHVPGHTTGSTAFLVRTTTGPALLTGDASHTAWGWEHCVEPGNFNMDGQESAKSLRRLKKIEALLPTLRVMPGHQALPGGRSATNLCIAP